MQTHNRYTFTTIHTEGALLPVDLLERISENDKNLEGLNPESYHLAPGEKLNEAINRSWNRLSGLWGTFQTARGRLGSTDAGTTLTRERWLLPLFQELGFGRLSTSKAVEIEGKFYPISHRWQNVPLHLVGCGIELDKRTPGAAGASRTSPHSLMQEYLNRSDDVQWGVISNGLGLRILRDNATLTRQAYIEFDLESMFDGEIYSDFVLLWLMCHQSRFEITEKQVECLLEKWSKSAQESGTRALDDLRRGVEEAIVSFGQGFLQHPMNGELRNRLKNGDLAAQDYYRQLLRLVYRLIFLFAAEDRDLLLLPEAAVEARQRFQNYYSTTRLRALAQRQRGSRHHDRYEALRLVMTLLGSDSGCQELAIPALGGFLFDASSTADLNNAKLDNQTLLSAVRSLAFITEGNTRRAVDYRNLGPEELGSVYESLLELHPLLNTDAGTFLLTSAAGNERKTTGSYYTPSSLIQVLLDSALDPVIEDRLKGKQDTVQQEQALLDLKVCDPACGSGHFLIAAAHRIAGRLAEVRAGDNEPSPNETRRALRDVIRHCIYGVDINPMAVELCKVNLWLESLEPGKPLSFLDAHIKCGNSLVGVGPKMNLDDLEVPDEAFNPVTGDHKPTAALLKKRNKQEREGQESLFVTVIKTHEDLDQWLAEHTRALEAMPEDTTAEVQAKAEAYQKVNESAEYHKQRQIADLWTAAFFWEIEEPKGTTYEVVAPTHGQLRRLRVENNLQTGLMVQVEKISQAEEFFHWPLEFAEVFTKGGFDCVLGNPPWERLQFEEKSFFASISDEIFYESNQFIRREMIKNLSTSNPALFEKWSYARMSVDWNTKFLRESGRFRLSAVDKFNLYALFAEFSENAINNYGQGGIIVKGGYISDKLCANLFSYHMKRRSLIAVWEFENKKKIFPSVHPQERFALITFGRNSISTDFCVDNFLVTDLKIKDKHVVMNYEDILLLSPNTSNCPKFPNNIEFNIAKKCYLCGKPLIKNEPLENIWNVTIDRYINVSDMSDEIVKGFDYSARKMFDKNSEYVPIFEGKLFHQFDHRFATYSENSDEVNEITDKSPNVGVRCYRYLPPTIAINRNPYLLSLHGLLALRDITNRSNERGVIATIIPTCCTDYTIRVIEPINKNTQTIVLLLSFLNSIICDYLARQRIGGTHLSNYIIEQIPVPPPELFGENAIKFLTTRVIELIYTDYALKLFVADFGYFGEPFTWDENRRAKLRAELDAYYAKLYGLTRDELRYILDPQDIYGPDFPGETFRVLKEKEIKQFGEYRTRRLVLEAWDRLEASGVLPKPAYEQTPQKDEPQESITLTSEPAKPLVISEPKVEFQPTKPVMQPKPIAEPEGQPTLSDFGLYKCPDCGKMVMGYEKENHEQEVHGRQSVEWKKIN